MRIVYYICLTLACLAIAEYTLFAVIRKNIDNNSKTAYSMNVQLKKSFDNYTDVLENTCKIIFTHKEFIEYDSTNITMSQYQANQIEQDMSEHFTALSLMNNYTDFGFVYKNNHQVGKMSNGTKSFFDKNIYKEFETLLQNKSESWNYIDSEDFSRIIYLRRVNKNTIFIASYYATEFENVFADSGQLGDTATMLCDTSGKVLFGENQSELSERAVSTLKNEWFTSKNTSVTDTEYVASSIQCKNGWYICTVVSLNDYNKLYYRIGVISAVVIIICIMLIMTIRFFVFLAKDGDNGLLRNDNIKGNYVDSLTGLISAELAENMIAEKIETCITGSTIGLILVGVKNYRLIVENYGKEVGNEAVLKVSELLKEEFTDKNVIGKTGETEFIVFADFTDFNLFKAHDSMKSELKRLESLLEKCELDENRGYVKCSLGVAVYPDNSLNYDELYEMAKKALSESDNSRITKTVFYSDDEDKSEGGKK